MGVSFHPSAEEELGAAAAWYEEQRSSLGTALLDEVHRAVAVIAESPSRWPRWPGLPRSLGVQRFLLTRFPYALAYRMRGNALLVLAVAHVRRRPGYWRHRAG